MFDYVTVSKYGFPNDASFFQHRFFGTFVVLVHFVLGQILLAAIFDKYCSLRKSVQSNKIVFSSLFGQSERSVSYVR